MSRGTDGRRSGYQFSAVTGGSAPSWRAVFNGAIDLKDNEQSSAFRHAFSARYGAEPGPLAARAYDAATLVIRAVGNDEREARMRVARQLPKTSGYMGVSGAISIDSKGDNQVWRVTGYFWNGEIFVQERLIEADN